MSSMSILDTTMCGARYEKGQSETLWVYNSQSITGVRWVFMNLGDEGMYVACMAGNPADPSNPFRTLEEFRPVTTAEIDYLNWKVAQGKFSKR